MRKAGSKDTGSRGKGKDARGGYASFENERRKMRSETEEKKAAGPYSYYSNPVPRYGAIPPGGYKGGASYSECDKS